MQGFRYGREENNGEPEALLRPASGSQETAPWGFGWVCQQREETAEKGDIIEAGPVIQYE